VGVDAVGRVRLVASVPLLHPEQQMVEEMLAGWRNQQLSRNLQFATIDQRIRYVQRFIGHVNEHPWDWTPALVEEYFGDLRSVKRLSHSTLRGHQSALRHFTDYICNPDYGWDRACEQLFGTHPSQVFFDWNTASHVQGYEGRPVKRPFTREELQWLFDHADDEVERVAASGRKGWQAAYRDAVMLRWPTPMGCGATSCVICRPLTSPAIRTPGSSAVSGSARSATASPAAAHRTSRAAS
jgi:integrase/recombinase XerD